MPAHVPVNLIATGLRHELAGCTVLDDISLVITATSRLGVVGPNGVGKSTLLRVLAGVELPVAGHVKVAPPSATIGYLAQEPERSDEESVRAFLGRATGVTQAERHLERMAERLSTGQPGADEAYANALERWQALGAADFEARAEATFGEAGLPLGLMELPTAVLSGGQAVNVAFAVIILSRYDITLLDEPTNNLDFAALDRLERFIQGRDGGIVVVSHDRAFLDNTVTSVFELDERTRTGRLYNGGWSSYLEEKALARLHAEEAYMAYEHAREDLSERARREKQWAVKGVARERKRPKDNDKTARDFRINRTEQLAARAKRTERALARLAPVEKPWQPWDLQLQITQSPRSGSVVARLDNAVVERGSFKLGPIDLEISWAQRVALVGANGSGKTTLVGALLGSLPLSSGTRWLGPGVIVGELEQHRAFDGAKASLLEIFMKTTGLDHAGARSLLAKFGLEAADVVRPARSLSPGERTRAMLAGLQARGVNFLVLDEPTNHLDLPAVEQLEVALAEFAGTLLLVSHDRRLVQSVELTRTIDVSGMRSSSPA